MKKYKTYFDKKDTPFHKTFQPKRKYHVIWKRYAYADFLGHKTEKVKLFGIFRIKNPHDNVQEIIEGYVSQH